MKCPISLRNSIFYCSILVLSGAEGFDILLFVLAKNALLWYIYFDNLIAADKRFYSPLQGF